MRLKVRLLGRLWESPRRAAPSHEALEISGCMGFGVRDVQGLGCIGKGLRA